jgi:putative ABC transport system substrate-binding protein
MKRREFMTLIGGAAAAWPLASRAQQTERVRRIGAITGITDEPTIQARLAAFLQALQQLGWTDGHNVRIDYRYGGGDANNTRKHAAELAALARLVGECGDSALDLAGVGNVDRLTTDPWPGRQWTG